jgi:hypothetical protein
LWKSPRGLLTPLCPLTQYLRTVWGRPRPIARLQVAGQHSRWQARGRQAGKQAGQHLARPPAGALGPPIDVTAQSGAGDRDRATLPPPSPIGPWPAIHPWMSCRYSTGVAWHAGVACWSVSKQEASAAPKWPIYQSLGFVANCKPRFSALRSPVAARLPGNGPGWIHKQTVSLLLPLCPHCCVPKLDPSPVTN